MSNLVGHKLNDYDGHLESWYERYLIKCELTTAYLDEMDCTYSSWLECKLTKVDFSLSYLWDARFVGCILEDCTFDKTRFKDSRFTACVFKDTTFFALEHNNSLVFDSCGFYNCQFLGMSEQELRAIHMNDCVLDRDTELLFNP